MGKASEYFRKRLAEEVRKGSGVKSSIHRKTGVARQALDNYLSGTVPGLDQAERIAEFFGETLAEFLGRGDAGHPLTECVRRVSEAALGQAESPAQAKTRGAAHPKIPARGPMVEFLDNLRTLCRDPAVRALVKVVVGDSEALEKKTESR